MKRYKSLLVILTFIPILLAGCGTKILAPDSKSIAPDNNVLYQPRVTEGGEVEDTDHNVENSRPMVMINGELYYDTGRESNFLGRCGVMDGKILSSVDGTEIPKEDNQSNFGNGYGTNPILILKQNRVCFFATFFQFVRIICITL